MSEPAIHADPASFRDPGGTVIRRGQRVLRALTASGAHDWRLAAGAAAELAAEGLMVSAAEVTDTDDVAAIKTEFPDTELVLEHELVPFITYPAEWSAAMVAEAGLLTLEIQRRLLKHGLSLKDATAYNVAFMGGKPVFLDAGSIVRPARLDVWYALGQFQRMFLYPLMLAGRGFAPGQLFLSHLDGVTPRSMAKALGSLGWLHPGRLFSVYLPAWLEGGKSGGPAKPADNKPTGNPDVQRAILNANSRRLQRLREKLKPRGVWVEYRDCNSYTDESERKKQERVSEFAATFDDAVLLDLGANTGVYSRILARHGRVIAVDADHDALDAFYREAQREKLARVDFVHANLANPTPGIGYMNHERPALLARLKADGAVALALTHHLLVTAGLSLAQVATLLASFAPRLLVEYVAPADPMFRRLVAGRQDLWQSLDEAAFTAAFEAAGMNLLNRVELSATRTLLELKRG